MIRLALVVLNISLTMGFLSTQADETSKYSREIDLTVGNRLRQIGQESRKPVDDYTFCRRVYLDAIGRIPTVDELDSFIQDKNSEKRSLLIQQLLESRAIRATGSITGLTYSGSNMWVINYIIRVIMLSGLKKLFEKTSPTTEWLMS